MYIQWIRRISETINSTDRRGYVVDPCRCHDLRGFLGDGFKDVLWFHHIVPRKFGETIQVILMIIWPYWTIFFKMRGYFYLTFSRIPRQGPALQPMGWKFQKLLADGMNMCLNLSRLLLYIIYPQDGWIHPIQMIPHVVFVIECPGRLRIDCCFIGGDNLGKYATKPWLITEGGKKNITILQCLSMFKPDPSDNIYLLWPP